MTRKLSPTLTILAVVLILPTLAFSETQTEPQGTAKTEPTQAEKQCEQWAKGDPKAKLACLDALSADIKYGSKDFDAFVQHAQRAAGFNVSALPAKDWIVFSKSMEKLKDQELANRVEYYVLQEKIGKRYSHDFKEVDDLTSKILISNVLEKDQHDRFFVFATTEDETIKINIGEVAQISDTKSRKDYIAWRLKNPHDKRSSKQWLQAYGQAQKAQKLEAEAVEKEIENTRKMADKWKRLADQGNPRALKEFKTYEGKLDKLNARSSNMFDGTLSAGLKTPDKAEACAGFKKPRKLTASDCLSARITHATGQAKATNELVEQRNAELKSKLMNIKDPPDIQTKKAEEKDKFWSNFAAGMLVLGFAAIFAAVMGAPVAAGIIGALGAGVLGTLLYQRWRANKKEKLAQSEGLADASLWAPNSQAEPQPPEPPERHQQSAKKPDAKSISESLSGDLRSAGEAGLSPGNPIENSSAIDKLPSKEPTPNPPAKNNFYNAVKQRVPQGVKNFIKSHISEESMNYWFR